MDSSIPEARLRQFVEDYFSTGLKNDGFSEAFGKIDKMLLAAANNSAIDVDERRLLAISFNIFRASVGFVTEDKQLLELAWSELQKFYDISLEASAEKPLIWWFFGGLRANRINNYCTYIDKNPDLLLVEKFAPHTMIDNCLKGIKKTSL